MAYTWHQGFLCREAMQNLHARFEQGIVKARRQNRSKTTFTSAIKCWVSTAPTIQTAWRQQLHWLPEGLKWPLALNGHFLIVPTYISTLSGFIYAGEHFFAQFAVKFNPRSGYNNSVKQQISPSSRMWPEKQLTVNMSILKSMNRKHFIRTQVTRLNIIY